MTTRTPRSLDDCHDFVDAMPDAPPGAYPAARALLQREAPDLVHYLGEE